MISNKQGRIQDFSWGVAELKTGGNLAPVAPIWPQIWSFNWAYLGHIGTLGPISVFMGPILSQN